MTSLTAKIASYVYIGSLLAMALMPPWQVSIYGHGKIDIGWWLVFCQPAWDAGKIVAYEGAGNAGSINTALLWVQFTFATAMYLAALIAARWKNMDYKF